MIDYFSRENIFLAWREFSRGKRRRTDIKKFEHRAEENVKNIHEELSSGNYRHKGYVQFQILDQKRRSISTASVNDRIIHHLVYTYLVEHCDKSFYFHSYSSRISKGTDKARNSVKKIFRKSSKNFTKEVWVLKCDVRKFFASVDHAKLLQLLRNKINDDNVYIITKQIVNSYNPQNTNTGLPLGNVTSQIFANIYLNELDYYLKQKIGVKNYIRYNDDFLVISNSRDELQKIYNKAFHYCSNYLRVHLKNVYIRKLSWGVDFLGHRFYPYRELLIPKVLKQIRQRYLEMSSNHKQGIMHDEYLLSAHNSYTGMCKNIHGNPLPLIDNFNTH